MNYDWDFGRLLPYVHAFWSGVVVTGVLTGLTLVLGTVLGVACGFAVRRGVGRVVLHPIIDVLRALPPLVLILFTYYVLTKDVVGITVPAFWVSVVAMSLNLAAFTADLVRAAVDNVPKSSTDAGRALGMRRNQLVRHIVLPHVVREIVPGMTALYIGMLKVSSLASIINVREVVFTAETVITNTSRSLESWAVVGVIYVVIVLPAAFVARRLERWAGRSGREAIGV